MRKIVHKIKHKIIAIKDHVIQKKRLYFMMTCIAVFALMFVSLYVYLFHSGADSLLATQDIDAIHTPPGFEWLTPSQVTILKNTYNRENDIVIAKSLLQQYITQAKYKEAYDLLISVQKKDQLSQIPGHLPAFIAFNYNIETGKWVDNISGWERSSQLAGMYDALYLLADKKYPEFEAKLQSLDPTVSIPLRDSLLQTKQTYKSLKDAPSYYYTGLIAATLMEAGYIPLAKSLATDILSVDKNYILSYELLSQIAIKKHDYTEAISLLKTLLTLDTQHIARTSFFLGLSYYHTADYSNARVYLNQVRDPQYIYDAIRYMILSYYNQGEEERMMDWFRTLLSEQKLRPSDYTLLFDISFYEPYMKWGSGASFALAKKYALPVIIPFIDSCRKDIEAVSPYICKYGEAGWYLSQNKPEKALKDLLYIVKTYPDPTVFQALWDYYTSVKDTAKADHYYMKALTSRADIEGVK